MLESNGFKTGRKATDKLQIVPPADFYKLECYTLKNTDTLETAKGYVDAAISSGKSAIIMIEALADADPSEQEWLTSDYTDLVAYIKEKENQGLIDIPPTISEWYNGLDGRRTSI
jgi:hypothetical protein